MESDRLFQRTGWEHKVHAWPRLHSCSMPETALSANRWTPRSVKRGCRTAPALRAPEASPHGYLEFNPHDITAMEIRCNGIHCKDQIFCSIFCFWSNLELKICFSLPSEGSGNSCLHIYATKSSSYHVLRLYLQVFHLASWRIAGKLTINQCDRQYAHFTLWLLWMIEKIA